MVGWTATLLGDLPNPALNPPQWHLDKPSPGDYYKYVLRWTKEGMCAGYAYMERAHMFIGAKCFLQVWHRGLFEGKGVSTSRVSPPGPLSQYHMVMWAV